VHSSSNWDGGCTDESGESAESEEEDKDEVAEEEDGCAGSDEDDEKDDAVGIESPGAEEGRRAEVECAVRVVVSADIEMSDEVEDELKTIIAMGGKVIDVMVEHPLYGEMKGMLMLSSIYDADKFIKKMKESVSEPLLVLTKGVHLHTIEAESEERLNIIEKELKRKGYLIDTDN
jgi:transcriptional regulator of NAD metabolism